MFLCVFVGRVRMCFIDGFGGVGCWCVVEYSFAIWFVDCLWIFVVWVVSLFLVVFAVSLVEFWLCFCVGSVCGWWFGDVVCVVVGFFIVLVCFLIFVLGCFFW